ncbi:MAG TPA: transposase [Sumerlaeia bacterium]|nr:transposase [Sumerlaeia bacterium]
MARRARVVVPGFPHHVTHGGNRRCDLFLRNADREVYGDFLRECAKRAELEICGYCLMTDHVHLICVPWREEEGQMDLLAEGNEEI